MGILSSVYHIMNPQTAGMAAAFAAHSTHILPIITITDKWAWLVRHSTGHCALDTVCAWSVLTSGSALFPLAEDWQTKCSQLLAEEYSSLFCNKEKFTSLHTKQSTINTVLKNCSCLGKYPRQWLPTVCTQNQLSCIYCHYTVFY